MFKRLLATTLLTFTLFSANTYAGESNNYVGLSSGLLLPSASILTDKNGDSAALNYDNLGASVSASLGHQFGIGLRVEEELFYKRGVTNKFTYSGAANSVESNVWSMGGMTNLYYDWYHNVDVMADRSFAPYAGAGVGFANVNMSDGSVNSSKVWNSGNDTVFAYQVTIGSGIKMSNYMIFDVSYRYFDAKKIQIDQIKTNFSNHNVLIGIRYAFK